MSPLSMKSTGDSVRISGKLSPNDLKDAGRLVRSKTYWLRILLTNWYGLALLLVVLWGTAEQVVRRDTTHVWGLALVWFVVMAIVAWSIYRVKRSTAKDYAELKKTLPDFVTVAPDGVHFEGPDGAQGFSPWTHFKRWREGHHVIVLDRSMGDGFTMLAVGDLQATERDALRRLLRLYLSHEKS